jgi:hypothetical protein
MGRVGDLVSVPKASGVALGDCGNCVMSLSDAELDQIEERTHRASPSPWEAFVFPNPNDQDFIRIAGLDDAQPDKDLSVRWRSFVQRRPPWGDVEPWVLGGHVVHCHLVPVRVSGSGDAEQGQFLRRLAGHKGAEGAIAA